MNREVLKHELSKLEISDQGEILSDVLEFYFGDMFPDETADESQEKVYRALELIIEKVLELVDP